MDIITHLYDKYAHISATNMAENHERLRASYNVEESLESLIKMLNKCADFTTASRTPVLETQLVCIAYVLI